MAKETSNYMSDSLIDSSISWLEDCLQYGACEKCLRHKEGLCLNAKSPTQRAVETIYYLREELAKAKGEKPPKRHIRAQEEDVKVPETEVKPEVKKRGRKPKNG